MAKKQWWADGVRFECQGSGKCCLSRGAYGYVYLTLKDRKRFAKFFGLTTQDFTKQYCDKEDGWIFLKVNPPPTDKSSKKVEDCQFLEGKRCTVYEARPTQCRTWPFWPENMNAKAWNRDVAPFCAGVGKGRLYSAEEIQKLLVEDPLVAGE